MKKIFTLFVAVLATVNLFSQTMISVTDGSLEDWDHLPSEYVYSCILPEGAHYDGLLRMTVYADETFINLAVEYNPEVVTDLSWTPFHIFIDTDNSSMTGGASDFYSTGSIDLMLETAIFAEGQPYSYNPAVFWWWGDIGKSGWLWTNPEEEGTSENCWGAIVCEGGLPIGNSQLVGNTFEIQLLRELIPAPDNAPWGDTFRIGVEIEQSWSAVGILPIAPDDVDGAVYTDPLMVQIKKNFEDYEFEIDGLRYSTNGVNSVEVTGVVNRQLTIATIPQTVTFRDNTYTVTAIGDKAFENCLSLRSVTIPESVTSIGDDAFSWCISLDSIVIPESVTTIRDLAFYYCCSLTSMTIPNSVLEIGVGAFYYCTSLDSIIIGNSVKTIGARAFDWCTSLTYITIGNNVTSIGDYAFQHCSSLISIAIPNSVTSIGEEAFLSCDNLSSLSIPSSVIYDSNSSGYASIYGCPNLKTLIVPADFFLNGVYTSVDNVNLIYPYLPQALESLTINGGNMNDYQTGWDFINRNCKTLKHIDFSAAESVPEKAFTNCYNLESLVLPSHLETVPYMAVAECVKLKSISIPATVTAIEDRAFENCRMLSSVTFAKNGALTRIGNWAFYNNHELTNIVIPEGVTEVGHAAFYGCTYLKEMTLPSTMQTIADNAFSQCQKVSKITVNATTPPVVEPKTFEDIDRNIPLYVPAGTASQYKQADYWCEFFNVIEQDALSSVENLNAPSPTTTCQKLLRDGQLLILKDGKTYNAMGQEM